jgi:hypothetical protein
VVAGTVQCLHGGALVRYRRRPPKVGGRDVPNCYLPTHAFILASDDNREWEAYLAYKGTIPWRYSIPLSAVVSYLKWRGPVV